MFILNFVRNKIKFGSISLFDSNFHVWNTNEALRFWISCMNNVALLIISISSGLTPSSTLLMMLLVLKLHPKILLIN